MAEAEREVAVVAKVASNAGLVAMGAERDAAVNGV